MTLQVTDARWNLDASGEWLCLLARNGVEARAACDEVTASQGKIFEVDLHPFRQKRSLRANAYAWELIGKIADVIRDSKDGVYLSMLKRYGQSELISVLECVPIEQYVKYCEKAGESVLNGKNFVHYRVYKGSSEFDSREMAIFIDGIVSEAKQMGIQTETPDELARMKSLWNSK